MQRSKALSRVQCVCLSVCLCCSLSNFLECLDVQTLFSVSKYILRTSISSLKVTDATSVKFERLLIEFNDSVQDLCAPKYNPFN